MDKKPTMNMKKTDEKPEKLVKWGSEGRNKT